MQLTHLRNTAFSYLDSSEVYVTRDDKDSSYFSLTVHV